MLLPIPGSMQPNSADERTNHRRAAYLAGCRDKINEKCGTNFKASGNGKDWGSWIPDINIPNVSGKRVGCIQGGVQTTDGTVI